MDSLNARTTVMSSIVLCAQSPSFSVPAGSVLMVPSDAMETQTAKTNRMRRIVKVSRVLKTPSYHSCALYFLTFRVLLWLSGKSRVFQVYFDCDL